MDGRDNKAGHDEPVDALRPSSGITAVCRSVNLLYLHLRKTNLSARTWPGMDSDAGYEPAGAACQPAGPACSSPVQADGRPQPVERGPDAAARFAAQQ